MISLYNGARLCILTNCSYGLLYEKMEENLRKPRMKVLTRDTYYHTMNRLFRYRKHEKSIFDTEDKKYFVNLMTKLTGYFNVEISSYCIMSNHYHIIFKQKC